jgi:hypothetical protein
MPEFAEFGKAKYRSVSKRYGNLDFERQGLERRRGKEYENVSERR